MTNVDKWDINKQQGDIGEGKVINWIKRWLHVEKHNQDLDIKHGVDITAVYKSGRTITIDVKTDFKIADTQHVVFETIGKTGNLAWGLDPEHINQYILVIDGQSDSPVPDMWIFRLEDMREYYEKNKRFLKVFGEYGETQFVLFPLKEYVREYGYWYVSDSGEKHRFIGNKERNYWKMN